MAALVFQLVRAFLPASLALSLLTMTAQGADPQASSRKALGEIRLDTPSGLPVPRFVSLKSEKTFCRGGPTFAHPIKITYVRRALPVMVVAETRDYWRKIRDAEGDECWIHRSKLSGAPTAMVVTDGLIIRSRPRDNAPQTARLGRGLITRIEAERDGWLKISADGVKGWAANDGFWGASNPR